MRYAIIQTGGKQYAVQPGDIIDVERLQADEGSQVELDHVLMLHREGKVDLGTPTLDGASVVAEVTSHGRGQKLIIFKFKAKTRYRRKQGHRQNYTRLTIKDILGSGEKKAAPAKRTPAKRTSGTSAKAEDKPRGQRRAATLKKDKDA